MRLNESPVFRKIKADGTSSKSPIKDSFGKWSNLRIVLLALFGLAAGHAVIWYTRSEEHTSELPSLMRTSYAVFCLKKKQKQHNNTTQSHKLTSQNKTNHGQKSRTI